MEKRMLKRVLATMCIISLILPVLSVISFATDGTETKQFGISTTDNNGVGYKIYESGEEKQVYRTYVIENSAKDYSKGIFCLEKNKDFPGESTQTAIDYNKTGDYTEKTEILKIADNMYLGYLSDTEKDAILNKIFAKRIADGADLVPPVTLNILKENITENDIIFAEQLAIWHYTDNYEWNNDIQFTVDGIHWMQYSDDSTKIDLMKDVYDYFVDGNNQLQLESSSSNTKTTKTVWTPKTGNYQKLLFIQKEEKPEQKIYDLALRKYITKVGDNEIDSRIPTIEYDESDSNKIVYKHKKDPIELKRGDKVVYTISVYNEGKNAAKPTKIIDYLPEGLEYVPASESTINTTYGWIPSADGKYAMTAYTSNYDDLAPYERGGNLSVRSVQIECRVKDDVVDGKVLTNIAEIAEDNIAVRDAGNKDIDSTPNNLVKPTDVENYKGKDTNPADLTKTDFYYRGQEDDDDFEKVIVKSPEIEYLDLALRKYITTINGDNKNREPEVDTTPLKNGSTTATYTHPKDAITVKQGDIVIYSIRIYNEGEKDAYADEITDYLPEGLGFLPQHKINVANKWTAVENAGITTVKLNTINNAVENSSLSDYEELDSLNDVEVIKGKVDIKSNKLQYTNGGNDNIIKAYNNGNSLDYKTLQVACVVLAENTSKDVIKNIAAITDESNSEGKKVNNTTIKDRDSQPEEIDVNTYPDNTNIQDDDDFEKLILNQKFDVALKKFIFSVEGVEITPSRLQNVNTAPLMDGGTDAEYTMDKTIVKLKTGNKVVYTIKIFNEGEIDAVIGEVVDTLPEGLEFIPASESTINKTYGWEQFSNRDKGWESGIKTEYLKDDTLNAFNKTTGEIDSREIQVELKVTGTEAVPIKNIAEITKYSEDDIDSKPNNKDEKEDDQDYDTVIPVIFDLALQKFITGLNGNVVTGREPKLSIDDNYEITYTHTKEPLSVANNNIVTYTIRVYNEGNQDGYVQKIRDDIPKGLVFLPDDELNKKYGWKEVNGEIVTDYLSKENSEARNEDNLLKAFDRELGLTDKNPDYRDVKVNFRVDQTQLDSLDRVIINTAEIKEHADKDGNDVTDKDSTPNDGIEGQDDIDKEYIELKYFDLALVKYVSSVVVKEDGNTKTIQTGHDGTENPEPAVKVEIHRNKLNSTEVTFIYTIRVTNQGQLEGYALEVKDRIPAGLSFYKEDNPNWEILEDGIVVTDALANTLLKPGESADVTIALRWDKSESNLGTKINTAEISKDKNDYDAPDIDSTPDNNVPEEDDQDIAPVLLSIKTGTDPIHVVLVITIITMLGAGIYAIKRFVL